MARDIREILKELGDKIEALGGGPTTAASQRRAAAAAATDKEAEEPGIDERMKLAAAAAKKFSEELKTIKESKKSIAETTSEMSQDYREINKLNEEINAGIHGQVDAMEKQAMLREELARATRSRIRDVEYEIKLLVEMINQEEELHGLNGGRSEELKKQVEELRNTVNEGKKVIKTFNDLNAAQQKLQGTVAGVLGGLLGINAEADSFLGTLVDTYKTAGGLGGVFQAIGSGMLKLSGGPFLGFLTGAQAGITKVIEGLIFAARELDSVQASFNATTGAGGKYNQMIEDNWRATGEFSLSMEENSQAIAALREGFTGIMGASQETVAELSQFTAQMGAIGIAGADAAKLSDTVFKSFRGGVGDVKDITLEFKGLADMMGKNVNEVVADFNKLMPELGKYGKDAIKIFKRLEYTAQRTGVSIDSLMSAAGQFDTIDGAAESVGKLNALMGGPYLNTVQMLNADEEQRIQLLKQSMRQSGLSWESLNKFQRQAIASAAGITDMNEAMMLFGTGLEAMDAREKAEEAKAAQDEWNESIKTAKDLGTKWLETLKKFTPPLTAILDYIHEWTESLVSLQQWMIEFAGPRGGPWALIGAFVLAKAAIVGVIGIIGKALVGRLAPALEKIVGKTENVAGGNLNAAQSFAQLKGSMYAGIGTGVKWLGILGGVALAALGVGKGVQWASQGIADMATAIGNMGDNTGAFIAALGVLAGMLVAAGLGIYHIGIASAFAWKPVLAFGGAIALVGAGIALAGLGIKLVMDSFSNFAQNLVGVSGAVIDSFSLFLGALAVFMYAAAAVGTVGAVGIGLVTAMVVGLGYAMSQVAAGFQTYASLIDSISKLTVDQIINITDALSGSIDVMRQFAGEIGEMDSKKVQIFSESLVNMGATLDSATIAANNPNAVQVIKDVSETITSANAATVAAASPVDRILQVVTNAVTGTGDAPGLTRGTGDAIKGPFKIIIKIDRDKIGEKVAEYIEDNKIIFAN